MLRISRLTRSMCASLLMAVILITPVHAVPYKVETIATPSVMHGVHGLTIGPDGALYAGSLLGHSIYRIDPASSAVTTFVGPPRGMADDITVSPDGLLVWTATHFDAVHARNVQGRILTLAQGFPGVSAAGFSADGRLFVSRIMRGDGLYEIDRSGVNPPRPVVENIGGLNNFDIAPDGSLYGPLFMKGVIVKIDINTGVMTEFAQGFMQPSAVKRDVLGRLVVLDYISGEVMRLSLDGKTRELLTTVPPPADGLAIAPNGLIYVSSTAFNGVTEIDPDTSATRRIVWGQMSAPGTLAVFENDGRENLLMGDAWGPRIVDPVSGTFTPVLRGPGVVGATGLAVTDHHYVVSNIWPFGVVQVIDRQSGKLISTLSGFSAPYDIKPVADGFIVVDYGSDRLVHVALDENFTRKSMAWALNKPVDLADAGGGVFYVTEYGKKDKRDRYINGSVSRVNTATNERTVIASRLKQPEGIAIGPDGWLIVAEVGAKRVIAIDLNGKSKTKVLAENLAIGLNVGNHVPAPYLPTGVAVTKNGAIYVTGDIDNVIYRITRP